MKLDYIVLGDQEKQEILSKIDDKRDAIEVPYQVSFGSGLTKATGADHAKVSVTIFHPRPLDNGVRNQIKSVIGEFVPYSYQNKDYSIPVSTYFQLRAKK